MPETLEIALLVVGLILFLLGVIGRVEAANVKAGTNNVVARIVLGLIGAVFLFFIAAKWIGDVSIQRMKETDEQIRRYQQQYPRY